MVKEYIRIGILWDYLFIHLIVSSKSYTLTAGIIYHKRISIVPKNICNIFNAIIDWFICSDKCVFSSLFFNLYFHW